MNPSATVKGKIGNNHFLYHAIFILEIKQRYRRQSAAATQATPEEQGARFGKRALHRQLRDGLESGVMQVREAKDFLVQQTAERSRMEGEGAAPLAAEKKEEEIPLCATRRTKNVCRKKPGRYVRND
jgi:hypothetical protein